MGRLLIAGFLCLISISSVPCFGQVQVKSFAQLEDSFPGVRFHDNNGIVNTIYGTTISTGVTPLESAWNHLNGWREAYGEDMGTFVPQVTPSGDTMVGVMPNPLTGDYKFYTFRFNQTYGGLPVFRSGIGFLVRNAANNPLVMSGFDVKEMAGFDVAAGGIGQIEVSPAMLKNVQSYMDGAPDAHAETHSVLEEEVYDLDAGNSAGTIAGEIGEATKRLAGKADRIEVSEKELVIWAGINNVREEPRLAISFIAQRGSVQSYPHYDKYLIVADANSGEILLAENQITNFDVGGTVSGRAHRRTGFAGMRSRSNDVVTLCGSLAGRRRFCVYRHQG